MILHVTLSLCFARKCSQEIAVAHGSFSIIYVWLCFTFLVHSEITKAWGYPHPPTENLTFLLHYTAQLN